MTQCIYITSENRNIYIRCIGHVTALFCPNAKERFLSLIPNSISQIYVDLHECEYMDSTFIGFLVIINKHSIKYTGENITVINPHKNCIELLTETGVFPLINITNKEVPWPKDEEEINRNQSGDADLIFDAHHELSQLSEKNKERFKLLQSVLSKKNRTDRQN